MQILAVISISLILAVFLGRFMHKIRIPEVVGFILVGLFLGISGLSILSIEILNYLSPLITVALSFIGFSIGSELRFDIFRTLGKSITSILISEATFAFFAIFFISYLLTSKIYIALILAAIGSATAPATTVNVIWEYKAKGVMTTIVLAIVALDDMYAMTAYSISESVSKLLIGSESISIGKVVLTPVFDIVTAAAIGFIVFLPMSYVSKFITEKNEVLTATVGFVMLCSGIAQIVGVSPIMASMFLGILFINTRKEEVSVLLSNIRNFTPPIYVLFFILIGAKLNLKIIAHWYALVIGYVAMRSLGKVFGSWLGATVSNAENKVKKYLGMCLFAQEGVSIGLAMAVYQNFAKYGAIGKELGNIVVNVITATTIIILLIGPPCERYALIKAGEAGASE